MDVNTAAAVQTLVKVNPDTNSTAVGRKRQAQKAGKDFGNILSEFAGPEAKKEIKDIQPEGYIESVLGGSFYFQTALAQAFSEENQTVGEVVMDAVDIVGDAAHDEVQAVSGIEDVPAEPVATLSFAEITDAFADMIATDLLPQYITKNYPNGTAGQNPRRDFANEISDIVLDRAEEYSGFTKTQMTNPNMTADVMKLNEFADENFADNIVNDIISVVFDGEGVDESKVAATVKNAVQETMLNVPPVQPADTGIVPEETAPVETVQPAPENNVQPEAFQAPAVNTEYVPAPEVNTDIPAAAVSEPYNVSAADIAPERLITMSDGTVIPESKIARSVNMPDEKGIYPAGTEYIESTPFIGKGESPAVAVLMAKVGDEDGLVRASDFIKARNIVFSNHQNIPSDSPERVYMPVNEAVSGVIEYAGSEEYSMSEESSEESSAFDFTKSMDIPNLTVGAANADTVNADFQVPEVSSETAPVLNQMIERITGNLIQSQNGEIKQMQIQLHPETLGNIVIKLESSQNGLSVKIIASNTEVRDMIAQSAVQMSDSIRAQGVNLLNINVSHPAEQHENFDGSSGNSAFYENQSEQRNNRQNNEKGADYREYMKAAENEKIRRVLDSIRSFGV